MNKTEVLKEIIESRRSIFPKSYSSDEIGEEVLKEIVNAAHFAPNHKKTKPWRLQIFRAAEKDQLGHTLADIYKDTCLAGQFLEKKICGY